MTRSLSTEEIGVLCQQGCSCGDWGLVTVAEAFAPSYVHDVVLCGAVHLGAFTKDVDSGGGVLRHSGVRHAVLCDTTVGDDCLIENIGTHICGYTIGAESVIINVGTLESSGAATSPEVPTIAVLAEMGERNVPLCAALSSPVAALLLRQSDDSQSAGALRRVLTTSDGDSTPVGTIGCRCRLTNCGRLTNVFLADDSEVDGATLVADSSILGGETAPAYLGAGVQVSNSIIAAGATITGGSIVDSCYVGRGTILSDGVLARSSLFFDDCHIAAGEVVASCCGPGTVSHHRGTLLIASTFALFNAGAGTTMANHAYKMGPVHSGTFARGCKTGTAAYLSLPAQIAPYTVCIGTIMSHPDARDFPFSYLFGSGTTATLVPGRALVSAGIWRDIHKWQHRYRRAAAGGNALLTLDWLSPYVVEGVVAGCTVLAYLRTTDAGDDGTYKYQGCTIKASALENGLRYYDMALHLFMGQALDEHHTVSANNAPLPLPDSADEDPCGTGAWADLGGLLLPVEEEQRLLSAVRNGEIKTAPALSAALYDIASHYSSYRWAYAQHLIQKYYKTSSLTAEVCEQVRDDYAMARHDWRQALRKDAEREHALGDVPDEILVAFLSSLDDEDDEQ